MRRRTFLGGAAAAALASPRLALGADAKTLRFIPQSDVTILDPIWTTGYLTHNHGLAIFDTQ